MRRRSFGNRDDVSFTFLKGIVDYKEVIHISDGSGTQNWSFEYVYIHISIITNQLENRFDHFKLALHTHFSIKHPKHKTKRAFPSLIRTQNQIFHQINVASFALDRFFNFNS